MRTTHLLSAFLYCSLLIANCQLTMAQSPQGFSFQSVIRDGSGDLVVSSPAGMKISLLQGSASGTAVYVERHTPTTNANGLASIVVGSGTVQSGTFATIDWAAGPYFIKSETDPNGGTSYTISGTQQLMSVPYALHAGSSDSDKWAENGTGIYNTNSGNVGIGTQGAVAKLEVRNEGSGHTLLMGKPAVSVLNLPQDFWSGVNIRDNTRWQSFTAEADGDLTTLTIWLFTQWDAPNSTVPVEMKIYDGEGVSGTLLSSFTSNYVVPNNYYNAHLISIPTPIAVTSGNLYTFSCNVSSSAGSIYLGATYYQTYPGGVSSVGDRDYFFKADILPTSGSVAVDSEGQLGIGTTSPSTLLHVAGNVRIEDGTEGSGKVLTSDASGNASWTPSSTINPYIWTVATASVTLPCGAPVCPTATGTLLATCPSGYSRAGLVDATPIGAVSHSFDLNTPITDRTQLGVDYSITSAFVPTTLIVKVLCVSGVPGL